MGTAMEAFPIPEGYHPPFAIITEKDHSGYIIIACALGTALMLLSISIRIFLRSAFGHGFGRDDVVVFVAAVSSQTRLLDRAAPTYSP